MQTDSPVQRLGRPPGQAGAQYESYNDRVVAKWDGKALNVGPSLSCSNSNTDRALHYCLCGKHMRVMLVGSAQKAFRRHAAAIEGRLARGIESDELSAHASCLWCKICNVPAQELQQVSECAQRFHSLLLRQYKDLFVLQEYKAPQFQGILDLYCPDYKLGIMIDGEQHFSGTRCNEKQVQSDETFNAGVLQAAGTGEVQGLVRLHHADNQNKYGMILARGLELSRDQCVQSFVLFSPSFLRQDIIVRTRHDHESGKHE